ncbi:serine hydrolase [Hymenobacter sp. YC55]|uniref:serine hydrolase n=1 Tax=Hymenobacter sp. YC55 TaxID=3034019 RepID=UPI0023F76D76|nr:serine hydrolase [Hymenobacter sp. YC55]MDF7813854.1 serine hydrolase [Hymenobacter sp. YC55]
MNKKQSWIGLILGAALVLLWVVSTLIYSPPQKPPATSLRLIDQPTSALLATLQAYGLHPELLEQLHPRMPTDSFSTSCSLWPAYDQQIVAALPGTHSQGTILLFAQYSRPAVAGARIGGNGAAALLRLVDSLTQGPPLPNDITVFFSTAAREQEGEASSFRNRFALAQSPDVVLELEHQDPSGDVLLFYASKYHYRLVEDYVRLAQRSARGGTSARALVPPRADNALDFVRYLGTQPLADKTDAAAPAVSVLVHPQTGRYEPALQPLDDAVQAFLQKWRIPGGAVALTKDGRLVYARGFGLAHRKAQTLVQPTHQFRIASLSKPITAAAIMLLVESQRLQLDSPVFGPRGILADSSYGTLADERMAQITIRHLLEHSAGWDREVSTDVMFDPVEIARLMDVYPPAGPKSIIRYALNRSLDFAPGTRYAYSNVGYCVLGRVIEQLTHQPYEDYVQTHLLAPLGITAMRIGASIPTNPETEEVRYYAALGSHLVPSIFSRSIRVPFAYGGFYLEAMDAHGGWIASAPDLLRFLVAVDGFATKPDLLSPATLQQMTTPNPDLHSGYGLGWWVNAENSWCHTGSLPGSSALLERTSTGYTWVILLNSRANNAAYFPELGALIRDKIKHITSWPTYDLFDGPAAVTVTPATATDTSFHTPLLRDSAAGR